MKTAQRLRVINVTAKWLGKSLSNTSIGLSSLLPTYERRQFKSDCDCQCKNTNVKWLQKEQVYDNDYESKYGNSPYHSARRLSRASPPLQSTSSIPPKVEGILKLNWEGPLAANCGARFGCVDGEEVLEEGTGSNGGGPSSEATAAAAARFFFLSTLIASSFFWSLQKLAIASKASHTKCLLGFSDKLYQKYQLS